MGRMHLSIYQMLWRSWVCSRKYERFRNKEESSRWVFSRLKERVKKARGRHGNGVVNKNVNVNQHSFSKSLSALYVLLDYHKEKEEKICKEENSDGLWIEKSPSMRMARDGNHSRYTLGIEEHGLEHENGDFRVEDKETVCYFQEHKFSSTYVGKSVVLVKYSYNPCEDFRNSIMEMILESSVEMSVSDLKELLYCYFKLNSPEHYDLIERAFIDALQEV